MDGTSASATNGPGKRGSALPRFGFSKVPAPGSSIPKGPAALRSPPAGNGQSNGVQPVQSPALTKSSSSQPPSASSTRAKVGSQSGFAIPHRPAPSSNGSVPASAYARQPLASTQARPGQHERYPSVASTASSRSQYTRHNSLQSDFAGDRLSGEESETTIDTPLSPPSNGSSLKLPKKSRPSLSERAIESLSNVPPSPLGERRRSSFFNPQSPMTPQRPPSSCETRNTASRVNFGAATGRNTIGRPSSPTKTARPTSIYGTPGPPRRSYSTNLARPGSAASNGRPTSPVKPRTNSTGVPNRSTGGRPVSMIGAPSLPRTTSTPSSRPISTQPARPGLPSTSSASSTVSRSRPLSTAKALNTGLRKRGQTPTSPNQERRVAQDTRGASPMPDSEPEQVEAQQEPKAASSSALRQRIAEAKAAARNAQRNQKRLDEDTVSTAYDFEACDDPFRTNPKNASSELQKRLDNARRDGRLNIAAMNLTMVPDEVLRMYESEAMEKSSVPWNETVDLTRLNAADNEITDLGDNTFPDVSPADMVDLEDSNGAQFGGLEHIDLHGNKLHKIPAGLRQLSRLTTLNLSRNKLDTTALTTISQIPTLCDLNLSNNTLEHDLSESIGRLSLLEKLDVSNNKLSSLPSSLRDLGRLRVLNLSHNRLQSLPFEAIAKMATLRELSASHNAFSGALIPSSITELANLRVLDVSNNACASLTFSRTLKLPALLRLDISSNRLGMFKDISDWTNLTTLIADDNCLREMPQGMTQLTQKLRMVSVERNTIPSVPEEVADMEALETLNLTGNPIYERRLVGLDVTGIKRLMIDKRELAAKMSSNK